jgi:hypothetical protein
MKRFSFFFLFLCSFLSADVKYDEIFGLDYRRADSFLKKHSTQISVIMKYYGGEPEIMIPAVFPELLRFSIIRENLELTGLKIFYINLGSKYSDFSIGAFQMKPSFIEDIEKDVYRITENEELKKKFAYRVKESRQLRSERLKRIEDIEFAAVYLAAFYQIVNNKYKKFINKMNTEEKVLFFSAAYNSGYKKGFEKIMKNADIISFPYGTNNFLSRYSYPEISLFYYNKNHTFFDAR